MLSYQRTCCGFFVKVRFKRTLRLTGTMSVVLIGLLASLCAKFVQCNRPPRFLIDGQTEIVLRLKEGEETPVGSVIYNLRGVDPDGDRLQFGVRPQSGSDVIRVESTSASEAHVYLNQELDRETRDEYALVLTLTDGRLGQGNFITQSLLLLVEDVNDNTPIFKPYHPSVTLAEDASPGIVTTLQATDADEGAYGQVVYHIQEVDGGAPRFSISTIAGKGVIRLTGSLDYEKQTLHQLKVLATDRAKQGRVNTGTAALLIKVKDVEDQPPEFVRVQPVARIPEDTPIGTSILQVIAVDGDRGINNAITYSLTSNSIEKDDEPFTIESRTGTVLTSRLLDRETLSSTLGAYILQITATEVGSSVTPAPSAVTEVTIMVTDVNDEAPKFRNNGYACEISENAPINTPLTFLGNAVPEVFDHDLGDNGTFQLYLTGANEIFEVTPPKVINEASFLIRVKNSTLLDFEQVKVLNFSLVAREMSTAERKLSEVPVVVHITDRNDNFPEFTRNVYEVSVPENCETGTTVVWVQALDEDSGRFGTEGVRYTNLAGSIENLLFLHPISGVITVKVSGGPSWDREQVTRHYLTVEARDDLGNGNRNTVQLIINIEDINDNAPKFTKSRYEARLLENEDDFEAPLRIEARDADLNGTKNSEIEYTLLGVHANKFTVHPKLGLVLPAEPVDFEKLEGPVSENVRSLHLTVRARDWGTPSLFSDAPLTIYVQDVNDNAPRFERIFYNKTVPEDIASGTSILQIKAEDLDGSSPNNRVVYRIQKGAADKFVISAESGIISVARGASLDPDLTQPRIISYSLIVVALDGAPGDDQLQAAVTVNVTVLDVNNKPPVFTNPGIVNLLENIPVGTIVTRLRAKDLDSSAVLRFRLDPETCEARTERNTLLKSADYDCQYFFNLGETDGVITTLKVLDREVVEIVNLGVIVEDTASETGLQIDKAKLTVVIEDINDNNPKFRRPFYRFAIAENSKNGIIIGVVTADDPDKNKTITYTLEGPPEIVKLVYLDGNNGDVIVANKIDHEVHNWLNLTVKAVDSGVPRRSSRVELYIQILDENDNNPYFLPDPRVLVVPEDTTVGQKVAVLEARDSDSGEFGKVTYLLDRISSQGKFNLDPDTGVLTVAEELDRETKDSYLLVVEAWDNYQYGYSSGESRNAFKHINVTILDVNDNPPQLIIPPTCVSVTEFHETGQPITVIQVSDADDPETVNGQIIIDIATGNQLGLFALQQINEWSAEIRSMKPLRGRHGNYTLLLRAQDLGTPSHQTKAPLQICVTDFNDHAPVFVTPPHNSTLRVPENATVGSALIQIVAADDDVGSNGAVRYRLKVDPGGHWKTFNLQPVSGILELRLPLDRQKQKIYDIRIEAYDLGMPTALSSDLDLTVYVSNMNDYQPQFLIDEFKLNFTENVHPGEEVRKLPDTIDRDELEFEGPLAPICYYIVGGNEKDVFKLNPITHDILINTPLDREKENSHLLLVKASEDCINKPANQSFFDSSDDTLLKVIVKVLDVNDNPPKFIHRVFTGGVSTATTYGTVFLTVKAEDADTGGNAEISYYLVGKIQMTLTEGLDSLRRAPFLVDRETGGVQLNFDPQKGMKGYFDFMVLANDTGSLQDMARVFIYLLREDQRVMFVLRQQPTEIRNRIEAFRGVLGNVTGAIVNIDEFRVHANHDGSVDKTRTDLYLHLVDREDNSILEVDEVLRLVDQNTEKLDNLFKEFNVLDTQPGEPMALSAVKTATTTFWLTASSLFLLLLLLLCLSLCINQRQTYQRKLKAATATAYVGADSEIDGRGLSGLSGRVPNTNKHSMEGSNPIWLQAYENEWYKHTDDYSQGSEHDSLDENVLCSEESINCDNVEQQNNLNRNQNVYQTLPPALPPQRKLETTEL